MRLEEAVKMAMADPGRVVTHPMAGPCVWHNGGFRRHTDNMLPPFAPITGPALDDRWAVEPKPQAPFKRGDVVTVDRWHNGTDFSWVGEPMVVLADDGQTARCHIFGGMAGRNRPFLTTERIFNHSEVALRPMADDMVKTADLPMLRHIRGIDPAPVAVVIDGVPYVPA